MAEKAQAAKSRVIETTIEIDAPVEAVWKALTDAQELARWFPLKAEVKPGAGGSIWLSWGPPWEGGARIEIWEPGRHLRTRGFIEPESEAAATGAVAVDYQLESRGGKTVLRLVHSGFEARTDWDDELFDGTRRGWRFELRALRHYLERHRGQERRVIWPRVRVGVPAAEAWRRMLGSDGFLREGAVDGLREGDRYHMKTASGDLFEGVVAVNDPPIDFAGTVENLNGGYLGLRMHEMGGHEAGSGHEASVWLSSYEVPQAEVDALGGRLKTLLERLFAA